MGHANYKKLLQRKCTRVEGELTLITLQSDRAWQTIETGTKATGPGALSNLHEKEIKRP